jgi:hypothetical protein
MHVADDKNRLGFVNPTQLNKLELNPVINGKSETFKGMSNKKWIIAIKKYNKNWPKRKEILHQSA